MNRDMGDYEEYEIYQDDPEFFKSKTFEFDIGPGRKENGYLLDEDDFDIKDDLKGDNRAWNHDYMKGVKARTTNNAVTENKITDGNEYKMLRTKVESSNRNFKDKVFPPNKSSILGFGPELELPNYKETEEEKCELKWKRP